MTKQGFSFCSIKNAGFSLLEIIIAMAIMAILTAVLFPKLGEDSDKLAKKEMLRLVAAIELVRDQSVITNQEFGLNIDQEGYQFLRLNEKEQDKPPFWELIEDNPVLSRHEFAPGLDINFTLDGDNVFKKAEQEVQIFEQDLEIFEQDEKPKKVDPPQIYFLSTGEQNKFSIGISAQENASDATQELHFYRVRGFLTGNLEYEGPLEGSVMQDIDRDYKDDV